MPDFPSADLFSLTGQVVLLTGGYGYLGQAIARGLAGYGATVVVLGRDEAAFQTALAAEANLHFQFCDVADTASVRPRRSSTTPSIAAAAAPTS